MHPRAAKLTELASYLNLEEGTVLFGKFAAEEDAYDAAVVAKRTSRNTSAYKLGAVLRNEASMKHVTADRHKGVAMRRLNKAVRSCRACPKLNCVGTTEATVPDGNYDAKIVIVGPGGDKWSVRSDMIMSQMTGRFVDCACRLSGIDRASLLFTNAVLCFTDSYRATGQRVKDNCRPFLQQTLAIIKPELVIALGNDAQYSVSKVWNGPVQNMTNPAAFLNFSGSGQSIVDWVLKLSGHFDKIVTKE